MIATPTVDGGTVRTCGTTWYDFQHNGTAGKMVAVDDQGFVHMVWMKGLQADYVLELNSGVSQLSRAPLYLPAVQFMAYYRALWRGLNPDRPERLSYWVDISK